MRETKESRRFETGKFNKKRRFQKSQESGFQGLTCAAGTGLTPITFKAVDFVVSLELQGVVEETGRLLGASCSYQQKGSTCSCFLYVCLIFLSKAYYIG